MSVEKLVYFDKLVFKKPKDFSFFLTASVYNFSFWFSGERFLVPLEDTILVLADFGSEIEARVYVSKNRRLEGVDELGKMVEHVLGLGEDLTEFYGIVARDTLLSPSLEMLYGMHMRASPPWIASVIGVCQQNASFKQGWKMFYNFIRVFGKRVVVEDVETYVPPSPSNINENSMDMLLGAGLGYRAKTVVALAKLFTEKQHLNGFDVGSGELEEELLSIRGVGEYTSRLALALSLRDYSKPPIDRWLRRIVSEVYRVDEKNVEREYIRVWGRWSALAALYTTVALDAEPLTKALERVRAGQLRPDPSKISPLTLWKHL
ncbi:MAG: hypothetical protein QXT53_04755 [Ignisphaera sp.]